MERSLDKLLIMIVLTFVDL